MTKLTIENDVLIRCITDKETLEVPMGVKSIGGLAFAECDWLYDVILPDSVTTLEDRAFAESTVSVVSLPDSVTKIGKYAFSESNLLTAHLPEGLTEIEEGVFRDCARLKSVSIPERVTKIGGYAFSGCNSLESIRIPDKASTIGEYAFANCEAMGDIKLPLALEKISEGMLLGCGGLRGAEIPERVKTIEESAFCGCFELEWVDFPDGIEEIGKDAFSGCFCLKDINLPDNVRIDNSAFMECKKMYDKNGCIVINDTLCDCNWRSCDTITITEGVTKIASCAIEYIERVGTLVIPSTLREIEGELHARRRGLSRILLPENTTPELAQLVWNATGAVAGRFPEERRLALSVIKSALVSCGHELCDDGQWRDRFADYSEELINELKDEENLPALDLLLSLFGAEPETLDEIIGQSTGNVELTAMVMNHKNRLYSRDELERRETARVELELGLREPTLAEAEELFELERRDGIVAITGYIGREKRVFVPAAIEGERVTRIEARAFANCTWVKGVILPDSIEYIGEMAFLGCSAMEEFIVPLRVTRLRACVLGNCHNLERVMIHPRVSILEAFAFYNSHKVTVHTPRGSKAARYAAENGIPCVETEV